MAGKNGLDSKRKLDNWIEAYLVYTHESEAPEEFHQWVAISTIAGVLRRSCYFDLGYFHLYPNLFITLVSPAGRCKKSTSMRIARPMLAEVPGIKFTVDSITRERMIQDMGQAFSDGQSAMTAYSSELASLLTSSGMDMVVFLTDIYDSPAEWAHKTKTGGTSLIKAPFLNLLAGTTPDWIARAMPLDTVGIGLTSRMIFVYSDQPRVRPAFPKLSKDQMKIGEMLKHDLKLISTISGEFHLSTEAINKYDQWYQGRYDEGKFGDTRMAGYYERKHIHILKTAMILCAAQRDKTTIELSDLEAAMAILEHIEEAMPRVFSGVGKNPLASDIAMISIVLENNPEGVDFSTLMNMFKHSVRKDELAEILETLQMSGHVKMKKLSDGHVRYVADTISEEGDENTQQVSGATEEKSTGHAPPRNFEE